MSWKEENPSPFESRLLPPKLIQTVSTDFTFASEILLEFPDDDRILTAHLESDPPLYVDDWTEDKKRSDHLHFLSQRISSWFG